MNKATENINRHLVGLVKAGQKTEITFECPKCYGVNDVSQVISAALKIDKDFVSGMVVFECSYCKQSLQITIRNRDFVQITNS